MKNIQDSLFMSELQQMRKNFANKGFTLLEVMIAVALIAIALTTLLGSQSQSVSFANSAKFETTAALLAQSKMSEMILQGPDAISSEGSPVSQII
jgi:type II secretion system protein I